MRNETTNIRLVRAVIRRFFRGRTAVPPFRRVTQSYYGKGICSFWEREREGDNSDIKLKFYIKYHTAHYSCYNCGQCSFHFFVVDMQLECLLGQKWPGTRRNKNEIEVWIVQSWYGMVQKLYIESRIFPWQGNHFSTSQNYSSDNRLLFHGPLYQKKKGQTEEKVYGQEHWLGSVLFSFFLTKNIGII